MDDDRADTAAGGKQPSPIANLDEVVHQKTRLGILAVLSEAQEADFSYLRTALGLTDGNLGRHLEILAAAGLVSTRKGYDGRRSRTWARITQLGATALSVEIAALKSLISGLEQTSPDRSTSPSPALDAGLTASSNLRPTSTNQK